MARSHAKFYVRAWRDDEWRDLSMAAQWVYWMLLTQPKLTLVGSLEVMPAKWSHLAGGLDRDGVEDALDELIAAGKVLIDEATEELLIRSFCKNDLDPNRCNQNLAKGLWGQWACIESHYLRVAAIDGMSDELWEKLGQYAPEDAVDIRRSPRLEPDVRTVDALPVGTRRSNERFEPPPSSHLPTDNPRRPVASSAHPQDGAFPFGLVARTQGIAARQGQPRYEGRTA